MEITGVQIASIVFSIFMLYFSFLSYRKNHFGALSFYVWAIVFIGLIIATIFPTIFIPIQHILHLARLFDLFIIIGIFFLTTLTFINFFFLQKINKKLEQLIQDEALNENKK